MRKIKILRIIARLNIGGPAIHTILLTEGLDKSKFDSSLVCGSVGRGEADMLYYAIDKNVKPYFIPELTRELNLFKDAIAFKKIYHFIKTQQPDIIHTHTAKAGALGRLAGIVYNFLNCRNQIKIIHTFHGTIFKGYFGKIKTKLFILIERTLSLFTAKIITLSESLRKELVSLGISNKDKIEVISLGFELEKFLSIPPRDNTVINIGIIGRLVPVKNHHLFLEVASGVIADKSVRQLKFKIIGDGELRDELKAYTRKLNINAWVDFLGWQRNLIPIYSNLDIIALTSLNEGTPVSLIEAMASGRMVIATDVGGVKDLLGTERDFYNEPGMNFKLLKRGILVKSGDCESFTAALIFILKHEALRKDMGICGREFVKERFLKERLLKDIENLYYNLLHCNKFF